MTNYLIHRFFQMAVVVLLATVAIYGFLNLATGDPMAGLNQIGDRKARFSESDKARLTAYLGLDKPLALRYLVWIIGGETGEVRPDGAIVLESALSFLGFGVQPPIPTWRNMLQAAQAGLLGQPGKAFYPGMAIFLASLAFNYVGDGMRDALDPRLKL